MRALFPSRPPRLKDISLTQDPSDLKLDLNNKNLNQIMNEK